MIVLIDATSSSLTVSWRANEERQGASPAASSTPGTAAASTPPRRYVLEYRKAVGGGGGDRSNDSSDGGAKQQPAFERLSDKLSTSQARKRNLADPDGNGFVFRAGAVLEAAGSGDDEVLVITDWVTHESPFHLLTEEEERRRMAAPKASLSGSSNALMVSWGKHEDAAAYELQMRENVPGEEWKTIAASLSLTNVKKKNLTSESGYQFRVRPAAAAAAAAASGDAGSGTVAVVPFSPPSDPLAALGLSDGVRRLFRPLENGTLLRSADGPPVPLEDALGGKEFVLLYASAHWCGPCRQFTPSLAGWYRSLGPSRTVEVVFLSADHDERGFGEYYREMPWLAVDYDDDARENLMAFLRVSGIPKLAVVDGRTGKVIDDNVVGKPFDVRRWRSLSTGGR